MNLVVELVAKDPQSAEQLSRLLTKALFSLGKRDYDIGSIVAMNTYLEEARKLQAELPSQSDD